jgi:hypothetical protein
MEDKFDDNFKYVVYATANHGDGMVQELGKYDFVDEITINVGMFSPDVQITIEKQYEESKD